MLTNIKLITFILIIGVLLLFANIPILNNGSIKIIYLWDTVSFIFVFLVSILILFTAVNNVSYDNKQYLNLRIQFLIENFILTSIIGILIGITLTCYMGSILYEVLNAKHWGWLVMELGMGMVTVFYGFIFSTSTYLVYKILNKRYDEKSKVINVQKSNWWVSLLSVSLAILIIVSLITPGKIPRFKVGVNNS